MTRPAGRFLHICYCCADAERATRFFVEALGMRNTMRTTEEATSGDIFGLPHPIVSMASFVYDARGPRVGPAIEVQGWRDPAPIGEAYREPNHVGIQALGCSVPDLAEALERVEKLGAQRIARSQAAWLGGATESVRTPDGHTLDLVERRELGAETCRLRHLRVTCSDLERSLAWYVGLGFERVETGPATAVGAFGVGAEATVNWARLRLPEEPFELVLTQWLSPASFGRHYSEPYHQGFYRAALRVEDTRAAYDAMRAEGWTFDRPPLLIALTGTPVPDMWITFSSDPDGIPYEFVQRPKSAFR
jgi:catechol 2,3-dioxygenase-like lactoylglutathione lyase family enzyme